jgi:hypothetical protein
MKLQRLIDSTTVVADQEKAKPHQQSLEPFILSSESPCRRSFFGCHHAICFCVAVAFLSSSRDLLFVVAVARS